METIYSTLTHYPNDNFGSSEVGDYFYHAVEIEFRTGQREFFLSESDAPVNPADGLSINGGLIAENGLPVITENAGYESGTATISGGTIKLLDLNEAVSAQFATKQANNFALMNSTCRIYTWPRGTTLDLVSHLSYTFVIKDSSYKHGVQSLFVEDINRNTDVQIFQEQTWNLNQTLTTTDTHIITTLRLADTVYDNEEAMLDANDFRFRHSDSYVQDPSSLIRYFVIEGSDSTNGRKIQILSCDTRGELIGGRLAYRIKDRNLFQTVSYEWTVQASTEDKNKQEVREWIYMEEDQSNCILALYTGATADGRAVPAHWHAGVSKDFVDTVSLSKFSSSEIRVISNPGEQKAKEYIEKEFLLFGVAVMTINRKGALSYAPMINHGENGASTIEFNVNNVDLSTVSDYRQETKNVKAVVGIKWDHNPVLDRYQKPVYWIDDVAKNRNRSEDVELYVSNTLRTGRYTESSVQRLAGIIYDRHVNPTQKISLTPDFNLFRTPLGYRCRINLDIVTDHVNGTGAAKPLDREMTLIGKTVDLNKRTVKLVFQGYSNPNPAAFAPTSPQLPDSEFMRDAIEITTVPGATWNAATNTLSGRPQLSLNKKYYHIGSLTLGSTMEAQWMETRGAGFKLWVKGGLFIGCKLDLSGRGRGRGGKGETDTTPATLGQSGYFGTTMAGGSWSMQWDYSTFQQAGNSFLIRAFRSKIFSRLPSTGATIGQVNSHSLLLSLDDGKLKGFPADPGGSGGGGTDRTSHVRPVDGVGTYVVTNDNPLVFMTEYSDGRDGGNGGAGFEFVSYAGSGIIGSGQLITSGGAPEGGIDALYRMGSNNGAPGMPGVVSWAIDGRGSAPVLTETNFHAFIGEATPFGQRALYNPGVYTRPIYDGTESLFRGHYDTTPSKNLWESAHSIAFVPPLEQLQIKPDDAFDLESSLNPDGNVVLYSQDVQPTNPNDRDLWITLSELARDTRTPIMSRYNVQTTSWDIVSWPDSVAFTLVQTERTYGANDGTVLYFTADGIAPLQYEMNDLWMDELNDTLWRLGPPHVEVNREEYGYYTAHSYVGDGNFVNTLRGDPTLFYEESLIADGRGIPYSTFVPPTPGPGETNDAFTFLNPTLGNYTEAGSVAWTYNNGVATSGAAAGADDGTIYISAGFGGTPGMAPDGAIRQVWAYVQAANSGDVIKIQSAGAATPAGDPTRQTEKAITNTTAFEWVRINDGALAHFRASSSQLQIRTQAVGMQVAGVILLLISSVDTPAGAAGFVAPATGGQAPRPVFPKVNSTFLSRVYTGDPVDPANPTSWIAVGPTLGDNNTPGVQMTAGGVGTHRYFGERHLFPVHSGRKYQILSNVKWNSIVRSNSADQGYAAAINVYDTQGGERLDNSIATAGASHWYGEVKPNFQFVTEVIEIPPSSPGVTWMSVQPTVHAVSGDCVVSEVKVKEITEYEREQLQDTRTTNPVWAGLTTIVVPGEEWAVDIDNGRQVDANVSMRISVDQGLIRGRLRTNAVLETGHLEVNRVVATTTEVVADSGGLEIVFSGNVVLPQKATLIRLDGFFESIGGVDPTQITFSSIKYTWIHKEGIRAGW